MHASNHATARTSSPPDPTLGQLAAVTCVSVPRGLVALACSFRMVGLIVDVSPCAPVTKEAEGCSTPKRRTRARKGQGGESRTREEEREKEKKGGDAHFAFPTCCSVQTSCIACLPIRQSKGNGISQGLPKTGVGGGVGAGRETTRGDDCRAGRVTVTTGAWHDGQPERATVTGARVHGHAACLFGKVSLSALAASSLRGYPFPRS